MNGKFTKKQAELYNLVLKANRTVMNTIKAGVNWKDMHLLSEKVVLTGLVELGLLTGDVEEMHAQRMGFIF